MKVTLTKDILRLKKFVSTDAARITLNGICLRNGKAIATNGKMLVEMELNEFEYDKAEEFKDIIVPVNILEKAFGLVAKEMKVKTIILSYDGSKAVFKIIGAFGNTIEISFTPTDNEYPQYETLFEPLAKAKFNGLYDSGLLAAIDPVICSTVFSGARLYFYEQNSGVQFYSHKTVARKIRGIIMPLRLGEKKEV